MYNNEILAAFFASFFTVLIAELGDKTQFITLTLSSRNSPYRVFGAALAALSIITAMAVLLGSFFSDHIPPGYIALISGFFFILMGFYTLLKKERPPQVKPSGYSIFTQTFSMVFVGEFGDKTQLAAIALTAFYQEPFMVFLGGMAAQIINHGFAAFIGGKYLKRIPDIYLKLITTAVFFLFGMIILWGGKTYFL